jgi:ubiquinone/menaquinone biosynthesis C-methylase UbiE
MTPGAAIDFTGIPRGFRNVDAHTHAERFASYLETVAGELQAQKRMSRQLLRPQAGQSLLDVGCGQGDDVRALAQRVAPAGDVVGVDLSERMIAAASQGDVPSNVSFLVADAHSLPFADNTFDGVLEERTLQHVENPVKVLSEMVRVVRPGGIVVASEPDWETVTIDSTDRLATRAIAHDLCDQQIRHGWAGRQLAGHFTRLGLSNVQVYPVTLVLRSLNAALKILGIEDAEFGSRSWAADLEGREAEGTFFASVTGFTVAGAR